MAQVRSVAVIGTGIMGAPIARHLLDAGFAVTVCNRSPKKARALVEAGARWADTPAAAAAHAQVVLTMVGTPEDVEEVYLGANGLLGAASKGQWLIDLTSSMPDLAAELAQAGEAMGVHVFDCPVTGGQAGAEAGTLTLMAGISQADAAPVAPVLEAFSSQVVYFDRAGAGQAAKLCNQLSLAGAMLGMAEAVAFARASDLPEEKVIAMVGQGMGASRALTELGPKAVDGDYKPGFKVAHFAKDLADALMTADDLALALPGAQTVHTLYATLAAMGGAELGTQALEVLYEPEEEAVAAGLDWSGALEAQEAIEEGPAGHDHCCGGHHDHGDDGCCGGHGHDHGDDGCGGHHGHGNDHCCGGHHGHHDHGDDGCCGGHGHDAHACGCQEDRLHG